MPTGAILVSLVLGMVGLADDPDYRVVIERWRADREAGLKADDGWLTLVGLHWLSAGETRLGSDPTCDVILPATAPGVVGTLMIEDDRVAFRPAEGIAAQLAGRSFAGGPIKANADVIVVGDLKLIVIKRGDRLALRVKDNASPARGAFRGLRWAPIDSAWRIVARFEPYPVPKTIVFDTIVGGRDELESTGEAVFERDGMTYRLQAAKEGDKLWFVFRDGTSGKTTHPGARQLTTEPPTPDGSVILDFNKAANLPCAYTPYATCPLAPRQNRLPFPIGAGELLYAK